MLNELTPWLAVLWTLALGVVAVLGGVALVLFAALLRAAWNVLTKGTTRNADNTNEGARR